MLSDTKLAVSTDHQILFQFERLGELERLAPNTALFHAGDEPDYLYVLIEGKIFIQGNRPDEMFWMGPGDFVGEIGFFLGTGRTKGADVGPEDALVWKVRRDILFDTMDVEGTILMTNLLLAMAPHIHIRLLTVSGEKEDGLSYAHPKDNMIEIEYECDHDHPSIVQLAQFMRGKDEWDSAIQVWEYVSHLPFRFGFWETRASKTLQVGFGTTTTKCNLQVALLRALGISAGFAKIKVPGNFYDPLKPKGYREQRRNSVHQDHDFAVVRLNGSWVPSDAGFLKEAWQLMADENHKCIPMLRGGFSRNNGYSVGSILGPTASVPTISKYLVSTIPNMDAGNIEGMNISLDKVQGAMYHVPIWLPATVNLLQHNPRAAYLKAYGCIVSDLNKFLALLGKDGANEMVSLII